MPVTLAVDLMGGDHGPPVVSPAVCAFLRKQVAASVIAVGLPDALAELTHRAGDEFGPRLSTFPASEVVSMDESVASALRGKKDSSLRVAINLVKEGKADAIVSAGNTGALMGIARFVLKTLPGIDRPAIATILPTLKGHTYVLDLGANVDCGAEDLLQFGIMGAMLVAALENKPEPSVGLLNIGIEEIKGNETVRRAGELLRASGLNFRGNVEGDDIYKGTTDVVVCDGFVGNIALKTSEGLAQMLATYLRDEFSRSWSRKMLALLAYPALKAFKERVDHRRYNGAALVGLRAVAVKSHGSADAFAFECALHRAYEAVATRVIDRIGQRIASFAESQEPVKFVGGSA